MFRKSLQVIISCSKKEIGSYKLVTSMETGHLEEHFFIMILILYLYGLMKKINLESFPCKEVAELRNVSID